MDGVLAVARALFLALTLGACTTDSTVQPVVRGLFDSALAAFGEQEEEAPRGKRTPTRAQIEASGRALVQFNLEGEDIFPILIAQSQNGPYVTYFSQQRQSLTLRESQITATRGLGTDLVSASSSEDDPLKVVTPPDAWPSEVSREYRFGGGPDGRIERYECEIIRAAPAEIVLAGETVAVIGFAENCAGLDGTFQNLYAADADDGRVLQSKQYVGRDIAAIILDVLEPVTE